MNREVNDLINTIENNVGELRVMRSYLYKYDLYADEMGHVMIKDIAQTLKQLMALYTELSFRLKEE